MPQINILSRADSKSVLRRRLRLERSSVSEHLRTAWDEAIRQHALELVKSRKVRSIACYWPFNGEPDITPLCCQLMSEGMEFALPVTSDTGNRVMQFHAWRQNTSLGKNAYGIFEPQDTAPVPLSHFDTLFIPLVGYDRLGNRLGMGAGYYDRYLQSLQHLPLPLRVGIAYSLQEVEAMHSNSWDIPLHGVVNELGWFTFNT